MPFNISEMKNNLQYLICWAQIGSPAAFMTDQILVLNVSDYIEIFIKGEVHIQKFFELLEKADERIGKTKEIIERLEIR